MSTAVETALKCYFHNDVRIWIDSGDTAVTEQAEYAYGLLVIHYYLLFSFIFPNSYSTQKAH